MTQFGRTSGTRNFKNLIKRKKNLMTTSYRYNWRLVVGAGVVFEIYIYIYLAGHYPGLTTGLPWKHGSILVFSVPPFRTVYTGWFLSSGIKHPPCLGGSVSCSYEDLLAFCHVPSLSWPSRAKAKILAASLACLPFPPLVSKPQLLNTQKVSYSCLEGGKNRFNPN